MEKVVAKDTNVKAQAQTNVHAETKSAEKDAEFKAKKAAAAKAFADRQKARKEMLVKLAQEVTDKKLIEKLEPATQSFIKEVLNPTVRTGFGGTSFFNKVFGDNPKVGDTITVLDYMKKTLCAKSKLDKAIKEWAEKGIVVEYTEKPNQLESVYKIAKLA